MAAEAKLIYLVKVESPTEVEEIGRSEYLNVAERLLAEAKAERDLAGFRTEYVGDRCVEVCDKVTRDTLCWLVIDTLV